MAKPKTKLPKVWVSVDDVGVEWCSIRKPSAEDRALIGPVHQYAPLQPPRRCVWRKVLRFWESCEGTETDIGKFCPRCGGRIVRRKS